MVSGGYTSTGIRNRIFSLSSAAASHVSRFFVSEMGGDLSSGSTMTVMGKAKDVVVYLSPTGSDADGLPLAGAKLASFEALAPGLVDVPAHPVAPANISTAAATSPRPSAITSARQTFLEYVDTRYGVRQTGVVQ